MGQLSTRSIRTFVLRQGRLTEGQQRSLDQYWNIFGIDPVAGGTPSHKPNADAKFYGKPDPNSDRIDLDQCFDRHAPIWMEIGFGNGTALAHMAKHNPEINFVGVEVHLPGVGHALGEIAANELTNVRVVRYDVLDLIEHFMMPASVDRVLIYFPDPWHKTRHHKRRMVNTGFLDQIYSLLRNDGMIHFATDWVPYANQVRSLVEAHEKFACLPDDQAQAIAGLRPETHFERRGHRLGHEVADLVIRKIP